MTFLLIAMVIRGFWPSYFGLLVRGGVRRPWIIHLLLLHHIGRRSGQEHVTPLLYVDDGSSVVLVGSNGGAEQEPLWVANVEAMSAVTIEVGERTLKAKPTVLRAGPERDRLYALAVDYWPDMLQYETTAAGRQFPVIRLDPQA